MTRSKSEGCSVVEEMFVSRLEADIPEFKHLKEKSPESMFHSIYACVFAGVTPCSKASHIFTVQFAARRKKPLGHGASLSISYLKVRSLSVLFLFSIPPPPIARLLLTMSFSTDFFKQTTRSEGGGPNGLRRRRHLRTHRRDIRFLYGPLLETVLDWKMYSHAKKEAANAPNHVVIRDNTLSCIFMPERICVRKIGALPVNSWLHNKNCRIERKQTEPLRYQNNMKLYLSSFAKFSTIVNE